MAETTTKETNLRQANAKATAVGVVSEKDLKIVTEDIEMVKKIEWM